MLKKYVSKVVGYTTRPFRKFIKDIIIDIIKEERTKPLYESLKLQEYTKTGKMTIYDAILNMLLHEISMNIEYIDPLTKAKKSIRYEYNTISEFKSALENFEPKYQYFTAINLGVYYEHDFGKQHVGEYPLSSFDNKVYICTDLQEKIIKPMLLWLNKHPELLI